MACGLVAVLGSTLVVWQSAYASFTWSSAPTTARVSTGTVVLADDDAEQTLFAVAGLKPGASGERCIRVTSTGTAPATVKMYGTGRSNVNGLAGALTLTVRVGGANASCGSISSAPIYNGTLAGYTAEGFGAGLGAWNTTGTAAEARTYRLVWTLPTSAPLSVQGGSAGVTFVWEAQDR